MITGRICADGNRLFIRRDDGGSPNIYLHVTVAERGGLVPPYDGQRVRCGMLRDAVGNCVAIEVAELAADALPQENLGYLQLALCLSTGERRQLIDLGYLNEALADDPAGVADAASRALRRVLTVTSRPAIRPRPGPSAA